MSGPTGRPPAPLPGTRAERAGRLARALAGLAGDAARAWLGGGGELPPGAVAHLADALGELRGAALKLGQLLALQGSALPPALAEALALLEERSHQMPPAQLERVLRRDLGEAGLARLAELDPEPLAAASIGQVHGAVSCEGRDLVLKVQYPGVARAIDADVDNLALLLRSLGLLPAFAAGDWPDALKRELRREADYRREARESERFGHWLQGDPDLYVPGVLEELSTRRVLATERVRGLPLEDLRSPTHPDARRDRLGAALLRLVLRELLELRCVQTDPNPANYLYDPKRDRIALLDFGAVQRLTRAESAAWRDLVGAAVAREPGSLVRAARVLGLCGDPDDAAVARLRALAETAAAPLRHRGVYDFAASDLPARVRARAGELWSTGPAPPVGALLVARRLGGTFLLLAHIGARVDARAIWEQVA